MALKDVGLEANTFWMVPLTFIFTHDILLVIVLLCADTVSFLLIFALVVNDEGAGIFLDVNIH